MMWNKIKIVAVLCCMSALVGTGSGWLAHSRSQTESSPPDARPPSPKHVAPVPDAKQADNVKQEIDKIHMELAILVEKEQDWEKSLSDAVIEARLQLLELKEESKWQEELFALDREKIREKIRAVRNEITRLEAIIRNVAEMTDSQQKNAALNIEKERKKALEKQLVALELEERRNFSQLREQKRKIRRAVIEAEVKFENLESRQSRQRENFASQRQRLQRRLQQLEDKSLDLDPADRLRDVERKLDRLQREVGELRRALERQGNDSRKRP